MTTHRFTVDTGESPARFVPITDEREVRRFLERAVETQARADLSFGDLRIMGKARAVSENWDWLEFTPDVIPDTLTDAQTRECLAIVYLKGQVLLGIRSLNVEWKKEAVRLAPKWAILKIQRRKEARYEIPGGYEIQVSLPPHRSGAHRPRFRLLDISPSGLSFLVPSQLEADRYRKGMFVKKLEFVLDQQEISIDAQVMNQVPITKAGHVSGIKVGMKFLRISDEDKETVTGYVLRHLAQIYD